MNRIKLILIAFVLIASIPVASATDVSGVIMTDTTWNASGSPCNVTGSVLVWNGSTLTIEPGVVVNFADGKYLWIGDSGKLIADGTPDDKITFTGISKTKGYWKGIVFGPMSDDASMINNTIIEYGGGEWFSGQSSEQCFTTSSHAIIVPSLTKNQISQIKTHGISLRANIITDGAAPTITNSTIRNSAGDGILCIGRSLVSGSTSATTKDRCCEWKDPTITCNWITNNTNGVHTLMRAKPKINDNNICGNSDYGVLNTKLLLYPPTVNAKKNWWGADDGPSGEGTGSGDAVSKYVDYSGWTGEPVPCAPIPELPAIILVAAGIVMLAGYVRIKRRD